MLVDLPEVILRDAFIKRIFEKQWRPQCRTRILSPKKAPCSDSCISAGDSFYHCRWQGTGRCSSGVVKGNVFERGVPHTDQEGGLFLS